jgi:hypothetical protein
MKILYFLICILLTQSVFSQKYALIDRNFKKPILFTDSVTINQVRNNYFPVRVEDLDSLLANFAYLIVELKSLQRSKFKLYKMKSGSTVTQIKTVSKAYGDSYDILLTTSANNVIAEYLVADNKTKNKNAIKNIKAFTNYIKKDKEMTIKEFREYNPIIYDATVYISTN